MQYLALTYATLLAGSAVSGCSSRDPDGITLPSTRVAIAPLTHKKLPISGSGLTDKKANKHRVDLSLSTPTGKPGFADEFTGRRVKSTIWRFDTSRNRNGWFNNEQQYYAADRYENARLQGGALVIEANREALSDRPDYGGQKYSSAKLVSRQSLGYGFYEVRAQLPCGRGIWPAIWLLPRGGSWPDQGEIDIMEMVGFKPNIIVGTVHSGAFNHVRGTQRGAEISVPTACTAMHRYQLDWRPEVLTIGVDGRGYFRVKNDQPGARAAWPFTRPFDLILNVAVGGDWGGQKGIDDGSFPQSMKVDYVRHWPR